MSAALTRVATKTVTLAIDVDAESGLGQAIVDAVASGIPAESFIDVGLDRVLRDGNKGGTSAFLVLVDESSK